MSFYTQSDNLPYFTPAPAWGMRLVLAALLTFASEILVWSGPPHRNPLDWLLIISGQLAIAALVLDWIVRFRVRDLYTMMIVFVSYAVLCSLLINPAATLYSFPDTLITRVIGANAPFGLELFGLFLVLNNGRLLRHRLLLIGYSLWLGFYFGTWIRLSPTLSDLTIEVMSLESALLYAAVPLTAALLVFYRMNRRAPAPQHLNTRFLLLTVPEWGIVSMIFVVILMVQGLRNQVEGASLLAMLALATLSYAILWTQRPETGYSILDEQIPADPIPFYWMLIAILSFSICALLGHKLELLNIRSYSQFTFIKFLFIVVGFTWLPLATSIIGLRAIDRFSRTNRW